MATKDNLGEAFAGESQANRKYLAFAAAAEKEGFSMVAKLFRAAAEAETVHALLHFRNLGGVGSTAENINAAIEGEGFEFQSMYPKFVAEAESENEEAALEGFKLAMAVEETHHILYNKAKDALAGGSDLAAGEIQVCQGCGHTLIGTAPDTCPVCGARQEKFKAIN